MEIKGAGLHGTVCSKATEALCSWSHDVNGRKSIKVPLSKKVLNRFFISFGFADVKKTLQ